ncbi:SAM-dependent methyltransferase [Sediminicola sp. YIK13]|uniref:tRNA (5-methylaminomethyl-2-thiouridine)(34)-methyltransferase MnmD n=1 Tax=Sediminicola sp. YIK13 TaxID=1453352 RepID=UPI000722DD4A|nr:tRNA (5-methylaminomethyl-2-thiouridine)(34)-methyltransferase MnmD [Sediminicola sp. YIK13]ALM07642.1 SAM-dependent methyltransferase [Sediminicola sp. YIK13]
MKRKIITTSDGSKTIQIEDWDEQYHSKHGAVQEAYHVFIKHGLSLFENRKISILEIGFGTGLNALITWKESSRYNLEVRYTGVEAFPVTKEEIRQLDYINELNAQELANGFEKMHDAAWEETIKLTNNFTIHKQQKDFMDIADKEDYNLIYFDAFGARVQPELWTETLFQKMFNALSENGVLVTYAAKGSVRRAMQSVGFKVERLPGPPGKREMLRAVKIDFGDVKS